MRYIDKLNIPSKEVKKMIKKKCPGDYFDGGPKALDKDCDSRKCRECWESEE